jgi:nicotinamidase-related amidase
MPTTTLRELNGFDQTPASLADATLILIDYQNTYTRGVMELTGWRPALESSTALLARARNAGTKVIHVVNDGGQGTPCRRRFPTCPPNSSTTARSQRSPISTESSSRTPHP